MQTNELNRLNQLEINYVEITKQLRSILPSALIKNFLETKRNYKKKPTKSNQKFYINESIKLAEITGLDSDDILNMSNVKIKEAIENITDFDEIKKLKIEKGKLKERLDKEKYKYSKLNTAGTTKARLNVDAKNVLEYYSKKMPQISTLNKQIEVLEIEAKNYKQHALKAEYNKCIQSISELKLTKQKITKTFKNHYKEKSKNKIDLTKDVDYTNLEKEKRNINKLITETSPTLIVKKFKSFKSNFNSIDIDLNDEESEIEKEYHTMLNKISDTTGLDKSEIVNMSYTKLIQELTISSKDKFNKLRQDLNDINVKISLKRSEIENSYSTEDMLHEIFDYSDDESQGKVPKEILASAYLPKVQSMVASLCYKLGKNHLYDEALGGGLVGFTVALNTWYEKQKPLDSALRFDTWLGLYVYKYAQRSLYEITTGGSGSTAANYQHFSSKMRDDVSKRVDLYIKNNPNMTGMKPALVEELFQQEEITKGVDKPLKTTAETDYNAIISGGSEPVDMWAISDYDTKTLSNDDILDGKQTYARLLSSISELMDLFDYKENKKTGLFEENRNKKLMDIYDRQIFLMYLGIDYKKTQKEVSTSKLKDKYTFEDIAKEVSRMKSKNGDNSGISASAIVTRWKRIISKLKIAVEHNQKIKAGLEYLLNYIDNNRELIDKLSNDREEMLIKNERDLLRENYSDNEDVLNIEMLDGNLIGDEYQISKQNSMYDSNIQKF